MSEAERLVDRFVDVANSPQYGDISADEVTAFKKNYGRSLQLKSLPLGGVARPTTILAKNYMGSKVSRLWVSARLIGKVTICRRFWIMRGTTRIWQKIWLSLILFSRRRSSCRRLDSGHLSIRGCRSECLSGRKGPRASKRRISCTVNSRSADERFPCPATSESRRRSGPPSASGPKAPP